MLVAAVALSLNAFKHSLSLSLCLFLHTTDEAYYHSDHHGSILSQVRSNSICDYSKCAKTQNKFSQSVNTGTPSHVIISKVCQSMIISLTCQNTYTS